MHFGTLGKQLDLQGRAAVQQQQEEQDGTAGVGNCAVHTADSGSCSRGAADSCP